MVNSQTIVFEKRALAVIPPRIKPASLVKKAKRIYKTPLANVFQGGSLRLGKMQFAFPRPNIVHIAFVRRDVKISAEQNICVFRTARIEVAAETLQPIELKLKRIRPEFSSVGDISIDNMYAFYRRGKQAFRRFVGVVGEIVLHIVKIVFGQNRHAVVRLFTEENRARETCRRLSLSPANTKRPADLRQSTVKRADAARLSNLHSKLLLSQFSK
jgi:hypothetical protein